MRRGRPLQRYVNYWCCSCWLQIKIAPPVRDVKILSSCVRSVASTWGSCVVSATSIVGFLHRWPERLSGHMQVNVFFFFKSSSSSFSSSVLSFFFILFPFFFSSFFSIFGSCSLRFIRFTFSDFLSFVFLPFYHYPSRLGFFFCFSF